MTDRSLLLDAPPSGWKPARFNEICDRVQDAASPSECGQRLYLGLEHLASGHPALVGHGKESDVRSGKTEFRKGDVLFGKLRPYLRKSVLVSEDGICSTDILVFRATEKCIPEFVCLLTHTDEFIGHAKATTSGVQHPRTSWSGLREFKLHVPSVAEQRKIAAVLGLVQRAIEQQERLIALTTELKKTLLHKLFTEGLHDEPQKQTEIGPVPESWEVAPCETLCEMITVGVVVKPASHYVSKGVPAFRSFNVREDCLETNDLVFFSEEDNDTKLAKSKLRTGDVLVVRTGYPGTSCVVPKEYDGSNCIDIVIVRPKTGVIRSGFLSRFFNAPAGKSQAVAFKHGLAQQHLNVSAVKRTLVPVPSLVEQGEIDSVLATVQRKIALISAKKETLTDLFRSLLYQLMTARMRVNDIDLSELECELGKG
jgi:type I restriction enzyme S subunit